MSIQHTNTSVNASTWSPNETKIVRWISQYICLLAAVNSSVCIRSFLLVLSFCMSVHVRCECVLLLLLLFHVYFRLLLHIILSRFFCRRSLYFENSWYVSVGMYSYTHMNMNMYCLKSSLVPYVMCWPTDK